MKTRVLWHLVFGVMLVLVILVLPVFPLSDTVATCIVVLALHRVVDRLSLTAVETIVMLFTAIWPFMTYRWITADREVGTLYDRLAPVSLTNVLNLAEFIMPMVAAAGLVVVIRRGNKRQAPGQTEAGE